MRDPAKTDYSASIQSSEYVWDSEGTPKSHRYLLQPIERLLSLADAKIVADVGCGNGALAAALSRRGFHMAGFDSSQSGIAIASAEHPSIAFRTHDLQDPVPQDLTHRFDAVVAAEVIEHLLLPRQLIRCALELLKPAGLLVVTTPYHGYLKNLALALTNSFDRHWHPLRDYGHVKFFSRATLTQLFDESGFTGVTYQSVGRMALVAKSMIVSGRAPS